MSSLRLESIWKTHFCILRAFHTVGNEWVNKVFQHLATPSPVQKLYRALSHFMKLGLRWQSPAHFVGVFMYASRKFQDGYLMQQLKHPYPLIRVPGFKPQLFCWCWLPANTHPGRQVMMAQVLVSLPPTREAHIEFWLLALARSSPSCYRHLGVHQSLPFNQIVFKEKKTNTVVLLHSAFSVL